MIYYLDTKSFDPFYNLAFEEYFLNKKKKGETYIILWQNSDTVVVGRYQNVYEEVNLGYAKENNIKIVRRNSGGGSVFHDLGNLNFSIISDYKSYENIEILLEPIISSLFTIGVQAEFSGRNDICVNGCKISGLAQYIKENKILYHGTLLIHSDLSKIEKVLTRNNKIFDSSSHPSIKVPVCNIVGLLDEEISVKQVKDIIISNYSFMCNYKVSCIDEIRIKELVQDKYRKNDWNYGYMPECNFVNRKRFNGGTVEVNAIIESGCIKYIEFSGDFFAKKEIVELEKALQNIDLFKELHMVINDINVEDYISNVSSEDILSLFDLFAKDNV